MNYRLVHLTILNSSHAAQEVRSKESNWSRIDQVQLESRVQIHMDHYDTH